MTFPNLLPGNRFRLNRGNGANPEVFSFVCTVTSIDLDEKVDFDDSMLIDCDTPLSMPQRVSTPKGQTWDITGSGKCDHSRYTILRNDFNTQAKGNWQIIVDQLAAQGGGTYEGAAYLDALKLSKSENGMVTFTFSLKGQALLTYTAAAS